MEDKKTTKPLREEFAEKFISLLQSDRPLDWMKGWDAGIATPYNAANGSRYHGINRMILMMTSLEKGYKDPRFMTFKQANQLGYKVKANEHATKVEYWMAWDQKEKKGMTLQEMEKLLKTDADRKREEFSVFPKVSYVFNACQIDGIEPLPVQEHNLEPNLLAEEVLDVLQENMGVPIRYEGTQAYYSPTTDSITLPPKESFFTEEDYIGTALHEFAHSTGHSSRLNRLLVSYSADPDSYSIEELRAEIASTFLSAELGVPMSNSQLENHMAYVQSWLKQVTQDHSVLFAAIKDAERISDYIKEQGRVDVIREKLETYANEPQELSGKTYEIWQLLDCSENRSIEFAPYDFASQFRLTESRYEKKWEGVATADEDTLEGIYYKFNVSRPDGFTGHSLSVSDVIVIQSGDERKAYYCDSVGFKEVEGFCKQQAHEKVRGRSA